MELHHAFTETQLAGSIIRSEQYWNNYLSKEFEVGGSLFVMTNQKGTIIAWLSVRTRGDNLYQLREFGCDKSSLEGAASYAGYFGPLLGLALQEHKVHKSCTLHLPTFILDDIRNHDTAQSCNFIDWDSPKEENDLGWIYRPICPTEAVQEGMPKITEKVPHLMWPSDSF